MKNVTKKIEVEEREYTLQHPGYAWYLDVTDNSRATGAPRQKYLIEQYLEHVVVDPAGLTIKDIEDDKELNMLHLLKLSGEIEKFLNNS